MSSSSCILKIEMIAVSCSWLKDIACQHEFFCRIVNQSQLADIYLSYSHQNVSSNRMLFRTRMDFMTLLLFTCALHEYRHL